MVTTLNNTPFHPRTTILPPEHQLWEVSHPRPSASLNLTRKGRIDGPFVSTMNTHNTIPRNQYPAHNSSPIPRPNNPLPRDPNQRQPSNKFSTRHTLLMDWHNSDQTVHERDQPATYVNNNHTQGTYRAQGKLLLASSDNLEDVSLNGAMKPRG